MRRHVAWSVGLGLIGLVLTATAAAAPSHEVRAVRLWESPDHTRAVFDLSGPIEYKGFVLENPARFVLDFRRARLAPAYDAAQAKGLVTGMRSGRPQQDTLRVVIDLAQEARPKTFLLRPAEGKGHRLVVDLYERAEGTTRTVAKSAASMAAAAERRVVVAIDAGHGGEDPGASGPEGTHEKDVTLAIARKLAALIDQEPGMESVLIRDGDYFVPLRKRYEKARDVRADLLISIHADAIAKGLAAGSSVYMLSTRGASSEAARWLADRENSADLVGGVSLGDKEDTLAAVLLDLSQGATLSASDAVASQVLESLSRLGRVHKREVQRANFIVLRSPDVPSILIETAFISNPSEEKRLRDPRHQQRLAQAVTDGVREYFHNAPPPGTWIAANRRPAREHIVMRGENLSLIAQRHGTTVARLRGVNGLTTDVVRPGAVLRIPPL